MNFRGYTSLEDNEGGLSPQESPVDSMPIGHDVVVGRSPQRQGIRLVEQHDIVDRSADGSPRSFKAVVGHANSDGTSDIDSRDVADAYPPVPGKSSGAELLPPGMSDLVDEPDDIYGDGDIYRPVPVARSQAPDFELVDEPPTQPQPSHGMPMSIPSALPYPTGDDSPYETPWTNQNQNEHEGHVTEGRPNQHQKRTSTNPFVTDGVPTEALDEVDFHHEPTGPLEGPGNAPEGPLDEIPTHHGVVQEHTFEMVVPSHAKFHAAERPITQFDDPNAVYYPAPIPVQLRLPPLLSRRGESQPKNALGQPRRKLKSGVILAHPPPVWEPSPLDEEITAMRAPDAVEDYRLGSPVLDDGASDRATVLSDDDYQEMAADLSKVSDNSKLRTDTGWLSSAWNSVIGKSGEEVPDDVDPDYQEHFLDKDQNYGFTRYDPEIVEQQTRQFKSGGVYSGARPANGKVTSLIEELEIRKAGRIAQRKIVQREADEIRELVSNQNRFAHPLDQAHQPTLLELQQVANQDYADRKEWHRGAVNKQDVDRANESLAQRRQRLKAQRSAAPLRSQPSHAEPVGETLAQRRSRLRREKDIIRRAQSQYLEGHHGLDEIPDLGPEHHPDYDTSGHAQNATPTTPVEPPFDQSGKFLSPESTNSMVRAVAMQI